MLQQVWEEQKEQMELEMYLFFREERYTVRTPHQRAQGSGHSGELHHQL